MPRLPWRLGGVCVVCRSSNQLPRAPLPPQPHPTPTQPNPKPTPNPPNHPPQKVHVASTVGNPYRTIVRRRYWPQLTITVLIPVFQQLTGINAIMWAPFLFWGGGVFFEGGTFPMMGRFGGGPLRCGSTPLSAECSAKPPHFETLFPRLEKRTHCPPPTPHPPPPPPPRFYAPQLFEATGASTNAALLASVVTGVVNVVSTLVAIFLVDR